MIRVTLDHAIEEIGNRALNTSQLGTSRFTSVAHEDAEARERPGARQHV